MIRTSCARVIYLKSFIWRLTTAVLLATATAYLAGCQTISTSTDVERRTTVQFVSANTLLIEARRSGLDTLYLRPLVLKRAALVASTKGYSHIRLIDARAWFAGGPSAAWHAVAQVQLVNADQAKDNGWYYAVEPLLAYPFRLHTDAMTNAATLVGSWGNPSQKDVYFWVAPIFVDMLDMASEFTAASMAGRVVTVPSGRTQIGAFIEYRHPGSGKLEDAFIFIEAQLESGHGYRVSGSMANNALNLWVEDQNDSSKRSRAVVIKL